MTTRKNSEITNEYTLEFIIDADDLPVSYAYRHVYCAVGRLANLEVVRVLAFTKYGARQSYYEQHGKYPENILQYVIQE